MQDFLNPKSMLTPGGAGALLMFLVNGIAYQFPEIEPRFMALLLSFLIGGILIISAKVSLANSKIIEKSLYWVLNSFIIFVVGFGSANIANEVRQPHETNNISTLSLSLVPEAYAQDQQHHTGREDVPAEEQPILQTDNNNAEVGAEAKTEKMRTIQEENERLKKELEMMKKQKASPASPPNQSFFRKW